jgi:SAM-dependent methyltransferase
VSVASWDALLAELPLEQPIPNVLDVGCGKGELLVRAVEHTGAIGVGVEPNPTFAADARERAGRRLGPGRVAILEADLSTAALPAEKFALGICTGSIHVFGEWPDALRGMAPLVRESGFALMAPTYWERPPHPDYLAAIEADENEAQSLRATLAAAESAGWQVLAHHESTPGEWDDYEHTYAANVRRWCDDHPDDPDAPAFRERIESWATAYAKWGRETMGYALLLMQREA